MPYTEHTAYEFCGQDRQVTAYTEVLLQWLGYEADEPVSILAMSL